MIYSLLREISVYLSYLPAPAADFGVARVLNRTSYADTFCGRTSYLYLNYCER